MLSPFWIKPNRKVFQTLGQHNPIIDLFGRQLFTNQLTLPIKPPTPSPPTPPPPPGECPLLPHSTPYQLCSPWPQAGGLYNSNSGYSPFVAKYGTPPSSINMNIFQINTSMTIAKNGTIYVIGYTGTSTGLFALNSDGSNKWTSPYLLNGSSEGSAPTIGPDGTIYFGDTNCYFYAITDLGTSGINNPNFNSGQPFQMPPDNSIGGSPLINSSGTIIYCSAGGALWFVSPDGNNQIFQLSTGAPSIGVGTLNSVAISSDGQNVYIGVNDDDSNVGSLFNINPNQTLNWSSFYYKETFGTIVLSPSISQDGYTIYIGCNDPNTQAGTIWGIQSTIFPGTFNWAYELPDDSGGNPYSVTTYNNGAILGIGQDGTIYVSCTSPISCAIIALTPTPSTPTTIAIPTLKWIYSIDNTDYQNISSPTIDSTGTIFVNMMALDSSTGINSCVLYVLKDIGSSASLQLTYNMGDNSNIVNSPVIGTNGILYSSSTIEPGSGDNVSNLFIFQ